MDHAIKQGFLEDWIMNWIKPIHKGVQALASNYRIIMVSLVMATLYSTIMEQNISSWAENHQKQALVKEALDQNVQLSIIWLH